MESVFRNSVTVNPDGELLLEERGLGESYKRNFEIECHSDNILTTNERR